MSREVMRQALEALENSVDLVIEDAHNAEQLYGKYPSRQARVGGLKLLAEEHQKAITALRAALEEPEHEMVRVMDNAIVALRAVLDGPKRKPLTDEEIDDIWNRYCDEMGEASINDAYDIARAIEARHGIKQEEA